MVEKSTSGGSTLIYGTPESVGMISEPLVRMVSNFTNYTNAANYSRFTYGHKHPIEPGSVNMVCKDATVVSYFADGYADLYADGNGALLPNGQREIAVPESIYDLASLTKLFTTVAALRLVDSKQLNISDPVASYIPKFSTNGKGNITIEMLLTHTSGFDADPEPPLYAPNYTNVEERRMAILEQGLINPPGSTFLYSDLNFMSLMLVLEEITGRPLDDQIGDYTSALGLKDTFFNRGNVEGPKFPYYERMVTEEFQNGPSEPKRPQPIRGIVHDENAWALDGVSGHAGLFSTVWDIGIFCQMILNNGTYGGVKVLEPQTVALIFHNFNKKFPGDEHGLGFELNQYYTAGPMAGLETASHTGFTGTSLVIDRESSLFFIHFANDVHPNRTWVLSNNIVREAMGYWVAKSLARDVEFPPL